jgi:hypothetical protein
MTKPDRICPVCLRSAPEKRHPCAFVTACACWQGIPCGAESRGPDSWARTARITRARNAPTVHDSDPGYRASMKDAGRGNLLP